MLSRAYVLGSIFSTCFILSSMCLCSPCHACVPRPRLCLSCHVLLWPLCPFCLSFLCFGLMVRTQSRPYGPCYRPYTKAHVKGFGSPCLHVYACLLLCFFVLASLDLGFATLDAFSGFVVVWLHLTPIRHCLGVTIWEASSDAGLLHAYPSLFAPCDAMLTMLVCATRWFSIHPYMFAYMLMHESCLLVCCPYFNTMKLWIVRISALKSYCMMLCMTLCMTSCCD